MNSPLVNINCIDEYTGDSNLCKNFSNTYLYHKASADNDKLIFKYLMECHRVDKNNKSFEEIRYEIKRRSVMNKITTALDSDKVVLGIGLQLPRAFRVFYGKDPKDNKPKIFIDCTSIITMKDGTYDLPSRNIDIFISYLTAAVIQMIYFTDPARIVRRITTKDEGARCFSDLVTYIIDYLRLTSMPGMREKCKYLACRYYFINLLGFSETDESINSKCLKLVGLSEREVEVINLQLDKNWHNNIKTFIDNLAKVFRVDSKLTLDVFIDKWMYLYGSGTHYATELFPAFTTMMIYSYVGAYINNQKTIEKVCGNNMVAFVKGLLREGEEVL